MKQRGAGLRKGDKRNVDQKVRLLVVGSGAGEATLEELVQHDKNILAIEVGQNERVTDTLRDARSDYDGTKNIIPLLTKSEGV